jgi:hypothetical protein
MRRRKEKNQTKTTSHSELAHESHPHNQLQHTHRIQFCLYESFDVNEMPFVD